MPRISGITGLLLWIVGTTSVAIGMRWGVQSKPVELHLANGQVIRGTVYHPAHSSGDLPAALVLHGMAVAHQSCAPGMALPLVDEGFLVLALDLAGHGRSDGCVPREELDFSLGEGAADADTPEVAAGIEFLQHHPYFTKGHLTTADDGNVPALVRLSQLTLIGHSRGGLVAARAAFDRADVDSVVCIGAAPAACDLTHPRNLLILSGRKEEYCRFDQCTSAICRATGGAIQRQDAPFGEFKRGTARRLMVLNDVTHLTELANPSTSRSMAEWVCSSIDKEAKNVRPYRLFVLIIGVLAATLGGIIPTTWVLSCVATKPYGDSRRTRPLSVRTIAIIVVPIAAVVPLIEKVARRLELGPVYFAGPAVALLAGIAVDVAALSLVIRRQTCVQPRFFSFGLLLRNAALGVFALGVAFVWLGVPWGMSWAALVPSASRWVTALALSALLLPCSAALASGFGRLVSDDSAQTGATLARGVVWLLIPATLWMSNTILPSHNYPLCLIPVRLLAASFVIPLPLWLLRDREGIGIARGVCHAGGAAWLFACHFPFV
jgi:pimeloyl-ACP methyl ester carboxylesterase